MPRIVENNIATLRKRDI